MLLVVFASLFILVLAVAVVGLVAVGMEGNYSDRAPQLAERMARVARHLNGDAEPPQLPRIFDRRAASAMADVADEPKEPATVG